MYLKECFRVFKGMCSIPTLILNIWVWTELLLGFLC